MKIEELKECFDTVTPTKVQRDKMLAEIMRAKEEPVKIVRLNSRKYLSVVAVIAIGVFVAVYSYVGKDILPQNSTNNIVENAENSTFATVDILDKTEGSVIVDGSNKADTNTTAEASNKTDVNSNMEVSDKTSVNSNMEVSDKTNVNSGAEVLNKADVNSTANTSNKTVDIETVAMADKVVSDKSTFVQHKKPTTASVTNETVENTENVSLAEEMSEAYPKPEEESVANTPSVAMYDNADAVRIAPAPEVAEEDYAVDAEDYSGGAGGGGGGGSAGGGAPANNKNISLSYIKNHDEYSVMFPTYFPEKFVFESAEKSLDDSGDFTAYYTSVEGGFIDMAFERKYENSYGINVITPEQLKDMSSEVYMDFTLDCGDYWVSYFTKNVSVEELYKIVTSSAYYR